MADGYDSLVLLTYGVFTWFRGKPAFKMGNAVTGGFVFGTSVGLLQQQRAVSVP